MRKEARHTQMATGISGLHSRRTRGDRHSSRVEAKNPALLSNPELSRPLGTILVGDKIGTSIETHRNGIVIAVGDVTTKTILTAGVIPNLSIVDFRVGRQPFPDLDGKFTELKIYRVPVVSGPGYIAREAVQDIQKWAVHPADA